MLDLLESGDKADVSFKIDDTIFPTHKLILGGNAPILVKFCEGAATNSPIVIEETTADVFHHVLNYIYGGEVPKEEDMLATIGKKIIDAADRFEVVGLKMAVEADLVAYCVIQASNVADY